MCKSACVQKGLCVKVFECKSVCEKSAKVSVMSFFSLIIFPFFPLTSSHPHICISSHPQIFRCSHLHVCASSHLQRFTYSSVFFICVLYMYIFSFETSSNFKISSNISLSVTHLAILLFALGPSVVQYDDLTYMYD